MYTGNAAMSSATYMKFKKNVQLHQQRVSEMAKNSRDYQEKNLRYRQKSYNSAENKKVNSNRGFIEFTGTVSHSGFIYET